MSANPKKNALINQSIRLMDARSIKQWAYQDPVMSRVLIFVQSRWPDRAGQDTIQPFFTRKEEIKVYKDCLLWGK